MNDRFDSAYETLFSELPINYRFDVSYPFDFSPSKISGELREIRNYISKQIISNSKPVRPDAKFYLLSSFLNMVLLPLLISSVENDDNFPLKPSFLKSMKKDIDLILRQSNSIDVEEISSHTIMKAIDQLWGELYSTSEALWTNTKRY